MNIGILQGRLLPPIDGCIQEFPPDWKLEEPMLKELGLSGVEWLITQKSFITNPIICNIDDIKGFPIISVCMDVLVNTKIIDPLFLRNTLGVVCEKLSKTSIRNLTIPILDESMLENDVKRQQFCSIIKPIGEKFSNLIFSFESELRPEKLNDIISLCNNFYVTYDTGNITSSGLDHIQYIQYFKDKINNVHLKDRTLDKRTVYPLTGDTKFDSIFKELKNINYTGGFVIQTARGMVGYEKFTILEHKIIFKGLYEKYF